MIEIDLPEGVVAHFTDQSICSNQLFPEEKALCTTYENQRLLDFCRGRYCAHQCLDALDQKQAVTREEGGAPQWPKGLIGSISHNAKLAGAIVTEESQYASVGLDIESIGRVYRDLWPILFTPCEIEILQEQTGHQREILSAVFFSIKEAYYKMQYKLTGMGMEFDDLEIIRNHRQLCVKALEPMPYDLHNRCINADYYLVGNEVVSLVVFR